MSPEHQVRRVTPGAIRSLLRIGSRAGLVGDSDEPLLSKAFAEGIDVVSDVGCTLRAFDLNRTDFFVGITLFAHEPNPVGYGLLREEVASTGEEPGAVLARLSRHGIVHRAYPQPGTREPQFGLTGLGKEIIAFATYRVLNLIKDSGESMAPYNGRARK